MSCTRRAEPGAEHGASCLPCSVQDQFRYPVSCVTSTRERVQTSVCRADGEQIPLLLALHQLQLQGGGGARCSPRSLCDDALQDVYSCHRLTLNTAGLPAAAAQMLASVIRVPECRQDAETKS